MNIGLGVDYDGSDWGFSSSLDTSLTFDINPPTDSLNIKAYLKPEAYFAFYDVGGPFINSEIFTRFEGNYFSNPLWSAYAGINVSGGARAGIFGYSKDLIEFDLYDYEKLIAQADDVEFPVAKLATYSDGSTAPLEVLLYASNSTGNIVEYAFDFGDGAKYIETQNSSGDGQFDGKTKHIYNKEGIYIPKVTVRNQEGRTDSAIDTLKVTAPLDTFFYNGGLWLRNIKLWRYSSN